jgi:imidazolonepropionase-like amidohydrolase
MEAMVARNVIYCGMHVVTQFLAGEGIEALEGDADFLSMFDAGDRRAFRAFTQKLQGGWTMEDLDYARRGNDSRFAWMARYRAMGGTLIAGTDMYFGGIMLHRELRNLEALGLSRLEVITAATGKCAKALGLDHIFGLIRPHHRADLVILNSNPLDNLAALRDIALVIKGGTPFRTHHAQPQTRAADP